MWGQLKVFIRSGVRSKILWVHLRIPFIYSFYLFVTIVHASWSTTQIPNVHLDPSVCMHHNTQWEVAPTGFQLLTTTL